MAFNAEKRPEAKVWLQDATPLTVAMKRVNLDIMRSLSFLPFPGHHEAYARRRLSLVDPGIRDDGSPEGAALWLRGDPAIANQIGSSMPSFLF